MYVGNHSNRYQLLFGFRTWMRSLIWTTWWK